MVESFEALSIGDSLDLYFEVHPPFVAGEPRKPEINAYVVASRYLRTLNGQFDVVFIDKGVEDGFAVGDVVMTLLQGTDDYKNATVQLINLRRSTSLALVLHNKDEIKFGDVVISAESE
ncbi:MAG: hypothetical protein GWN86_06330 [Desulfobacterales bacterium]|nr:hypothetical protein [Desulfobacterales bacterium]